MGWPSGRRWSFFWLVSRVPRVYCVGMRYNTTPNTPRPWAQVHVGVAPGGDARWRGVALGFRPTACIDRAMVLRHQRRIRNPNPVRDPR